jgi:ferrous iron transport protein A
MQMPTEAPIKLEFGTLRKGMAVRIVRVESDCEECTRLMELGLTVGTVFNVIKVAPFGDPVEIEVRGYRLCLRKSETHCFEIELAG